MGGHSDRVLTNIHQMSRSHDAPSLQRVTYIIDHLQPDVIEEGVRSVCSRVCTHGFISSGPPRVLHGHSDPPGSQAGFFFQGFSTILGGFGRRSAPCGGLMWVGGFSKKNQFFLHFFHIFFPNVKICIKKKLEEM